MEKILKLILILCLLSAPAFAQDRGALEDLQSKAKEKESELKKYKEEEDKISKELTAIERRAAQTEREKNKLESDISYLEHNIMTSENKKEALELSSPMWEDTFVKEAQYLLIKSALDSPYYFSGGLTEDVLFDGVIKQKRDFVINIKEENKLTKEQIRAYEEKNRKLLEQSSKIEQQHSTLTRDFLRKKSDYDDAHERYKAAEKELKELERSAAEVMKLLKEAEDQRKKEAAADAKRKAAQQGTEVKPVKTDAVILEKEGSLPWPVEGSVISGFGKEYRQDLKTWIFRDGIKVSARVGETVYSVAEGTVIYAGSFRSYGNVVILNHGSGFFTISGFLQEIYVDKGDTVGRRTPLGVAGLDSQQGSMGSGRTALYFEVRRGTTPEDPVKWLNKK